MPVNELLEKIKDRKYFISREFLDEVVETCEKKRFSYNEDGTKIRASQGHSVQVDMVFNKAIPPDVLFHGTVDKFMSSIRKEGLKKMNRHHVHLSKDRETASKVGSRRGKPIILEIDAAKMHQDGYEFFISDNGVWLIDYVKPEYIKGN